MSARLDWPGLLRAGLQGLRLSPGTFWGLTPHELALLLGEPRGSGATSRARLEELAAAFPDQRPAVAPQMEDRDDKA